MFIEVKKKTGESNEGLLRRFSKKVQSSGILLRFKKAQFKERGKSRNKKRQDAVRRNEIRSHKEYLRKIGRLEEREERRSGR